MNSACSWEAMRGRRWHQDALTINNGRRSLQTSRGTYAIEVANCLQVITPLVRTSPDAEGRRRSPDRTR
eukprot:5841903-Heterocapsa_arctica.AAC.1